MTGLGIRSVALLAWVAAFAAVLGFIGWQTDWGRELRRAPLIPEAAPPAPVAIALLPDYRIEGGLEARQQTVERPAFVPTRRPAPPPPTAPEAAKPRMQKGQFVLTGTAVVDQKSIAFLREAAGGKSRSVRVGETVNGLTVADVKPDRVRLTLGDESEDLVLAVAKGPRTTVQPAQPVVAAGAPAAGQPGGVAPGGAPVPGTAPVATLPGQPTAADAEASLLERRRAARAAQAAAEAAARAGQGQSAPTPTVLPTPAGAAPATATPAAPDPAWAEVYRRMQQPRR